jgi:pSer/pThr/pTyr-binding forkhead associated (FHA) protein
MPEQASQHPPIFKLIESNNAQPVALDRAVCLIGRRRGTNLPLNAPTISKVHAFIVREHGRIYVRDLASTNGVEVNGGHVQEAGLSDDDLVKIGSYTLSCTSGFTPDPSKDDAPPAELRSDDAAFQFSPGRHTLLIGRREGCDIRLNDPSLAPAHAILFELDGQHYVQELMPGGTLLNGRRIHREPLRPGDEVKVGNVALRYESTNGVHPHVDRPAEPIELPVEQVQEVVPVEDAIQPIPAPVESVASFDDLLEPVALDEPVEVEDLIEPAAPAEQADDVDDLIESIATPPEPEADEADDLVEPQPPAHQPPAAPETDLEPDMIPLMASEYDDDDADDQPAVQSPSASAIDIAPPSSEPITEPADDLDDEDIPPLRFDIPTSGDLDELIRLAPEEDDADVGSILWEDPPEGEEHAH